MAPVLRAALILLAVLFGLSAAAYLLNPFGLRDAVLGLRHSGSQDQTATGAGSVCSSDPQACDFIARVLGSTEEVWDAQFRAQQLPIYFTRPGAYQFPTLVVFGGGVDTGCGQQASAGGPFYCPLDQRIYIDPNFYAELATALSAPGDFAQAYVIAHEVGHHVQHLLEVRSVVIAAESANQLSVRRELQADCFAGIWANQEREDLSIDESDLREGLNAAFALGDDALTAGQIEAYEFTHGTSEQRMRWLRRGFESGDARECDTLRIAYARL